MRFTITALVVLALARVGFGQISIDEAQARLRARQAAKDTIANATLRPTTEPTPVKILPDVTEAIKEFLLEANKVLASGVDRDAALEPSFARILNRAFRLSATASDVTKNVPIGDRGLFGDRPDRAIAASFQIDISKSGGADELPSPTIQLYLIAPDDTMDEVEKGTALKGQVTVTRVQVNPIKQKVDGRDSICAGKLVVLAQFKPDDPIKRRVVEAAQKRPNPSPITIKPPTATAIDPLRSAESSLPTAPKSVVFLCDASGSMLSKFDTLKRELSIAIGKLGRDQSFSIICFQEQSYKSFSDNLVVATPEIKRLADEFLDKVVPRADTNPIPAIEAAFKQKPDTIFMLTDGDFPDDVDLLRRIREFERIRKVKICPIVFISNRSLAETQIVGLRRLATETGGTLRSIQDN